MDEFVVIKVMNDAMIKLLKSKKEDYTNNEKLKEHLQDPALFFKISKDTAFKILTCVGVKQQQLEIVYKKLTEPKIYNNLIQNGKIESNNDN